MRFERFDVLTRRLGAARSRRDVLRAFYPAAAALVTALLPRGAWGQASCPRGCAESEICLAGACVRPCENDRDCRSKKHDDPCMINACAQGVCVSAIANCLPGYECCRGECCPTSCEVDDECAVLDPCRWGSCSTEGQCVFTEVDPCLLCASDADCHHTAAETLCCGGACHRPCPEGTTMGKGCECRANASATLDGLVVRDDASG